jgi:uncharacterized protein YjbI with pentapeptide repeats
LDLIVPAFSSLKHHENQKQLHMLGVDRVLTIHGFVLFLLLLSSFSDNNIQFPIQTANAQEQEEGEGEMATRQESIECSIPPGPGVDLAGCDLSFANLSGANLTNANLTNAALEDVNLVNANLDNANLTNVGLTNANLAGATLTNANLTNAIIEGVDFTNAITIWCIGCTS